MNNFKLQNLKVFFALVLSITAFSASARGVYQTNQAFLDETFNGQPPKSQVIWLKGELRKSIQDILGHPYKGLRIRYWRQEQRSSWILEEIGKEQPITFGVVVNNNQIEQIKVLAFRESRGYEVRYPAFRQQFIGAKLNDMQLDRHIDGISGATLSVWAMKGITRLALFLDQHTSQ